MPEPFGLAGGAGALLAKGKNMDAYKDIWVYAELADGRPASVVLELLGKTDELKKKSGQTVAAVLAGCETGEVAAELLAHGADTVIRLDAPVFRQYKPRVYAEALRELVQKRKPSILLFGATAQGRDLAPRLQAKLLTGLTADCLDLDVDDSGRLIQTKPSYGGNVLCTIHCPQARPQMATVRPKVFTPLEKREHAQGVILDETVTVSDDAGYEVLGMSPVAACGDDIAAADIVIALGRGAGSDAAVSAARQLAEELHAAIAVTRPLTEDGRFGADCQIGQSGRTVKPGCILNFGISGAIQYTVGMRNAGVIVSVDINGEAPIFSTSQAGWVGDARELMLALIQKLRAARTG